METTIATSTTKPSVDFDQEVRFAVVMYGGASLAIYINGVAQELLRLVRATAPESSETDNGRRAHLADEDLRGSERVYRRLGRLLTRQQKPGETNSHAGQNGSLRTRFVVDILTGTSAGGINAVYLAKALANDQDMNTLKTLWVTEGDIGVLINDKDSLKNLGLTLPFDEGEPWSLLNSRRMYVKLLDALRGMDAEKTACDKGKSPLVDELDLYVTATDMFGRPIQMRLADDVVSEYRHRNVFRFRYRSPRTSDTDQSDFRPEYNAFLAFVARATSAHQAAFSPINLNDVTPIVENHYAAGEYSAVHEKLRNFYREYLLTRAEPGASSDPNDLADKFRRIWFVDGGTLDNKPFSFVIEQLPLRHADNFVDRKLLYIEPSPEQVVWRKALDDRPKIVGNALAGLSSLPRYETIVEDLTRLLERNRLVQRLDSIMRGMDEDIISGRVERHTRAEFLKLIQDPEKLKEWLKSKGASWGSYQRLRVAEVTDDLTLLVARAARFSEESDEFLAIRYLVRDWRSSNYDPHMKCDKLSELQFLVEFDLLWAMRRIRFVLQKLNELSCLSEHDKNALRTARVARGQSAPEEWPAAHEFAGFRKAVQSLRDKLNYALVTLRSKRRDYWSGEETNPFRKYIKSLEISSSDLLELLHEPTDAERRKKAEALLKVPVKVPLDDRVKIKADVIVLLTQDVKSKLGDVINEARNYCSNALRPLSADAAERQPRWERFLRDTLWYYYINFEDFDQVSHPLLYSTGVGEEADVIDVFRVSPWDSTALVDERDKYDAQGNKVKDGAPKLAGTTLGNFGAFFERKFRINDIMWGRLDGAERVIAALLPANPELRKELTREAHLEIIEEEAKNRIDLARAQANEVFGNLPAAEQRATSNLDLRTQMDKALGLMAAHEDCDTQLSAIKKGAASLPGDSNWRVFLESFVSEFRPFNREYLVPTANGTDRIEAFRNWFAAQYDEGRAFTESATLSSAARINKVLGAMALPYLAAKGPRTLKGKFAKWFARRIQLFTEAAIEPDGEARRKQRRRVIAAYILSTLIAVFVCLPAFLMWWRATVPWPRLGYAIIFFVTLPLASIPLLLTGGYNYGWVQLRQALGKRLQGARKIKNYP